MIVNCNVSWLTDGTIRLDIYMYIYIILYYIIVYYIILYYIILYYIILYYIILYLYHNICIYIFKYVYIYISIFWPGKFPTWKASYIHDMFGGLGSLMTFSPRDLATLIWAKITSD